ncbi:MAG: ribonuclease HII [Acidobacteriaceae bacterium]|nr:ribonuclease HII [Acidobacteriaceae bacterium]
MPFDPAAIAEYAILIGCDEVGTGALCGPVVTAAVWFDPQSIPPALFATLDDSKKLTRKKRDSLAIAIRQVACVSVATSSAVQIDKIGIRPATLSAMRRAILGLKIDAPVQVDGLAIPPHLPMSCVAVVKGDAKVPQIAAASIVAKDFRDKIMFRLAKKFPDYKWEKNVGYGTAAHLSAIEMCGPTIHHRKSYAPISQLGHSLSDGIDI